MSALKLHTTDVKARRAAAWSIAQYTYLLLVLGTASLFHLTQGSSWYWPAFGLGLTALFALGLRASITDFRNARTHWDSLEDFIKGHRK